MKTIGIASDHAGYELKMKLVDYLQKKSYAITDFGTDTSAPVDYPKYAHRLAYSVEQNECELGIALCGSGNGFNMTVNKYARVRGALCWTPEISRLARAHNDANICSLPARFITDDIAYRIIDEFLNTPFEGGRHLQRVKEIPMSKLKIENK